MHRFDAPGKWGKSVNISHRKIEINCCVALPLSTVPFPVRAAFCSPPKIRARGGIRSKRSLGRLRILMMMTTASTGGAVFVPAEGSCRIIRRFAAESDSGEKLD